MLRLTMRRFSRRSRRMMCLLRALRRFVTQLKGLRSITRSELAEVDVPMLCAVCCRFSASCGCGCVCAVERVQNRPDLHMRPYSATSCAHIALVELGGNGVMACYAASLDLLDDGADVGCKSPCICLQSRPAAFCNLGYVWIA